MFCVLKRRFMMMFFNRKGVSEVVANVLIVLLVIVGVAVIWSVVKPTIDKSAEQINTVCLEVGIEANSCKSNTATPANWDVVVKRSTGAGKLTGLKLIFEDSASGATTVVNAPAGTSFPDELETVTLSNLDDGAITADRVNVAAVVGDELRLCQPLAAPISCN